MPLRFWLAQIPANIHLPGPDPQLRAKLVKRMTKEVQRELEIQKRMYRRVTATWEEHHPEFITVIKDNGDTIDGYIGVDNTTKDGKVFHYLNDGTNVRKATMSNPFEPKTTPHVIGSRAGKGHRVLVSNNPKYWHRGITARVWSDEIWRRRRDYFVNRFSNVMTQYMREYFKRFFKR